MWIFITDEMVFLLGQEQITDMLIQHGLNLNATNNFGKTALHLAAQKGINFYRKMCPSKCVFY